VNKPNTAWRSYIPNGGMNEIVEDWHAKQNKRVQTVASPSTLTECPRVVWFKKHNVPYTNEMGWGTKQRLLLGRVAENIFARQLKDEGKLLWHWKDDEEGESIKFGMGDGLTRIEGTPDLLIKLDGKILISDAKTSRADSFAYVPPGESAFDDELWYHYKLQVECYYMLCHKNADWFSTDDPYKVMEHENLPLPQKCHLFSYALDDGVVKREFTWKPSQKIAAEILYYAKRWNTAYQSETMPECACTETQRKFCGFATKTETTRSGYKLGIECCNDTIFKVKEETNV